MTQEETPGTRLTPIHGTEAPSGGRLADPELPAKVADLVESAVDIVREKVVEPLERAVRAIVIGTLVTIIICAALVLVSAFAFRLLVELLALAGIPVWVAHAISGGIFLWAGLFCWAKRTPRRQQAGEAG